MNDNVQTFDIAARDRLAEYLTATDFEGKYLHRIPTGLGTEEAACSIAAINLAITGELTDDIPECMSEVIGNWIIRVQDAMPDEMRNSAAWRSLLPDAAGTGRDPDRERARLELSMAWMWDTVLPLIQPTADKHGFGEKWRRMCQEPKAEPALVAAGAAQDAAGAAGIAAGAAQDAAWQAMDPAGMLRRIIEA